MDLRRLSDPTARDFHRESCTSFVFTRFTWFTRCTKFCSRFYQCSTSYPEIKRLLFRYCQTIRFVLHLLFIVFCSTPMVGLNSQRTELPATMLLVVFRGPIVQSLLSFHSPNRASLISSDSAAKCPPFFTSLCHRMCSDNIGGNTAGGP